MKRVLIAFLVFIVILTAGAVGGSYYVHSRIAAQPFFMEGTTLDGEAIGGKTPEEVAAEYAQRYDTEQTRVGIAENEEEAITFSLKDAGIVYDEGPLRELLENTYAEQRKDIFAILKTWKDGYPVEGAESYTAEPENVQELVVSSALPVPREETADPEIAFDEKKDEFYITEGSEGNMIDDAAMQEGVIAAIKEAVQTAQKERKLPEEIHYDIPKEVYTSVPPAAVTKELQDECAAQNLELRKAEALAEYEVTEITYLFGEEKAVLDYDIFGKWLSVDDKLTVTLDEEAVKNYVKELAEQYNTQFKERIFHTSVGVDVTIRASRNEFGYKIDEEAETAQLITDLKSFSKVEREPVYIEKNEWGNPYHYSRNGMDDLNGNYVEVNLTRQHLWFYRDGSLVIESDIVSGCVAKERETQTGAFPLAYKESPRVLTGNEAGGSGSYSTKVQYWMAFYDGQGLHDASWRGSFGGSIYKSSGSHGCVNLPPSVAKTIYANISTGMAIIVYKE